MPPGRLHALIDGVIAIAITLLVLDLPRPADSAHLASDLWEHWPAYAAYIVSFATVGVIWIEHHALMGAVRRVNRRFIELTLMLLCFVSLVPWPTALAADYIRRGDSSASTAAFLYAAIMILLGLSISVAWSYLDRNPELVHEAARPGLPAATKRSLIGAVAYIPALAIAPVSAAASLAITAAIAVYFALSRTTVPSLLTGATDE